MPSDIPDSWLTQLKQTQELVWEMAERLPHMDLHDSRRRELWDQVTALKTELADSMTESRVVPTNPDLLDFYANLECYTKSLIETGMDMVSVNRELKEMKRQAGGPESDSEFDD